MVKAENLTVLLDMDGVIADLVPAVELLYDVKFDFTEGSSRFYKKLGISLYELETDLDQSKFWTDLKPTSYMEKIFQILKDRDLYTRTILCTQGIFRPEAHAGRLRWIREYCHDFYQRKAFINIQDKSLLANSHRLLVDDYTTNCQKFMKAGGWAIQFMADWIPSSKDVDSIFLFEQELDNTLIKEKSNEG
jgi:hypothetical protein